MKKSKTADIVFKYSKHILKDNLVNVGIGGSYRSKLDDCRDVDMILITRKSDLSKTRLIKEFLEIKLDKKVSISPITELQLQEKFFGDKMMTMIWKGCVWMYPFSTDFALADKTLELLPESLQRIKKAVLTGKVSESKVIDILEQYLLILWKYKKQ